MLRLQSQPKLRSQFCWLLLGVSQHYPAVHCGRCSLCSYYYLLRGAAFQIKIYTGVPYFVIYYMQHCIVGDVVFANRTQYPASTMGFKGDISIYTEAQPAAPGPRLKSVPGALIPLYTICSIALWEI